MIKILIVTALYEELKPFIDKFQADFQIRKLPNRNEYHHLVTSMNGKEVEIFATVQPDYSKVECACHTSRMMSQLGADIAVMIGICAGDKRKVNLGDIVVSRKVIDYETGKQLEDEFLPEIKSFEISDDLKQFLERFIVNHPNIIIDNKKLKIHFATVATGTKVIQKDNIFDELNTQNDRKVIGLDMEAYAFVRAVTGVNPQCYTFVVKSVCDFANHAKDDNIHQLSAKASAEWLYNFLQRFIFENDFTYILEIKKQVKYEKFLNFPALTNNDRKEWLKIIEWNTELEEFYDRSLEYKENDSSGMTFYPIGTNNYILEIFLAMHAYQASYAYSLVNIENGIINHKNLSFAIPVFEDEFDTISRFEISNILCGLPYFDTEKVVINIYTKFRGMGDGKGCTYRIYENGTTSLEKLVVQILDVPKEEFIETEISLEQYKYLLNG